MSRVRPDSEAAEDGPGRDYEVGYGRPPKASRFRVGGIGNPHGRPKNKKTVGQTIEEALMTRVKIEENARPKTMTVQEVIFRNLVRNAARGDNRAIQTLFALRERYKDGPQTTLNLSELEKEDRRILEEYLALLPGNSTDDASGASASETNHTTIQSNQSEAQPIGPPKGTDRDAS
jgi:hypothetical protein